MATYKTVCVFQCCFITVNLGSHTITICEILNNSTCPAYKESSSYICGIRYCILKFGTFHNQWPLNLCMWITSYIGLTTSSMPLRNDTCEHFIQYMEIYCSHSNFHIMGISYKSLYTPVYSPLFCFHWIRVYDFSTLLNSVTKFMTSTKYVLTNTLIH